MIRLNHAEITVPPGFTQRRRADFDAFFLGVLGFEESAFPGIEQTSLVYKTDAEASQFLFIAEHEQPMSRVSDDHLGLHVDSAEEVAAMLMRCEAFGADHPELEIRRLDVLDLKATVTHAFYVRYLLPIWFDIQHIAHKPGHAPAREWRFVPVGG